MAHILFAAGYQVDRVATAAEAMARLGSHRYSLVLADDRLPDGRGTHIADKAEALGIPVLILTGYALKSDNAELLRHEFIIKPVRPDELVEAVDRRLEGAPS